MASKLFPDDRADIDSLSLLRIIGFILLIIGIACILYYILSYPTANLEEQGGRMALIFLIIMLGLILTFPSFLTEDGTTMSAMRLISFIIISVFTMAVIKIGWEADSFDSLKIDASWMGVIGLAFGAKAVQRFFEKRFGEKRKAGSK